MTPQELKVSILQLAIQGKLVPQMSEEGTGEELYQQIQAEKQRLIKTGAIKKEKSLPEIVEDEIPFDVPENWMWVRIAQIVALNPKNDLDDNLETAFIPMPCIMDGFRNQHTFEIKKWKEIKKGFTHFAEGDIGVAKITPCFQNRKSVVFQNLTNGYGAGTTELSIVRTINDTVLREYLLCFFKTEYFITNGVKSFTGTAGQQRIHKDYLATCLIPLPPLAEQKRIVAKIEELLPLIDHYEQAWSRLEDFNKRFPVDMQKSILQMAIQGKLVPQVPEEGTGEELFLQIQAEKQRLIKAGTIKKGKSLPEITEDEVPFDIPDSWKWVYIGDLFQHNTGKALNSSDNSGSPMEYITTSNVYWNSFTLDKLKTMLFTEAEVDKCTVQKGDLLVLEGGDVGRAAIWNYDFPMRIQNHIHKLHPFGDLCIEYFYHIFFLYKNAGMINGKGIGIKGLSSGALHNLLVPLPPLAEQKRIVAKLEEILPLCERLK